MIADVARDLVVNPGTEKPASAPPRRRDLEVLTKRVFPALRTLIKAGYFSLDVEGVEHIPRSGPVVYVGNHAGWFTLDTLLGALALADHVGLDRHPWGAVQDELLKVPTVGRFFEGMGGFPASWLRDPRAMPADMQVFSIYPEGTEGNCKPFWHAYQMRAWRTGFLRLALARNAQIVPVAILGGEECLPVASTIRFVKPLLGTILPLPLSMIPLPSRWKFIFHPPVSLSRSELCREEDDADTRRRRLQEAAAGVRAIVQRTLDLETSRHPLAHLSRLLRSPVEAAPPVSAGARELSEGGVGPRLRLTMSKTSALRARSAGEALSRE